MKDQSRKLLLSIVLILCVLAGQTSSALPADVAVLEEASVSAESEAGELSSGYVEMASNGKLSLLADPESGCFTVKNKQSGRMWTTVPPDMDRDTLAKGKNKVNLQSLVLIDYFDPVDNIIDSTGSQVAVQHKGVTVDKIEKGIRIHYDNTTLKIRMAVEVVLEENAFTVTVPAELIEEYGPNYMSGIHLLPNLEAGFEGSDGWLFVPDGSGAVAEFQTVNKASAAPYGAPVYGKDANQSIIRQTDITESALLPVFGIQHDQQGLLGIITQGDGNAVINAARAGKKNMYNSVYPQFILRRMDQYDMGQSTGQSRLVNLFSTAPISSASMQVRYCLLEDENASLPGMAARCREYFTALDMTVSEWKDRPPVYIDFLGAVYKKAPVMGIPTDSVLPVTSFSAAQEILSGLQKAGLSNPVVRYNNWNSDQIAGQINDSAAPSGKLGGKNGFQTLVNSSLAEIYPSAEFTFVQKWQPGYSKNSYAAKSIKNVPTALYEHNIATSFADSRFKEKYLLSASKLTGIGEKFLQSYKRLGNPYLDMGSTARVLYSDYSVRTDTREDSKMKLMELYRLSQEAGNKLMISGGNGYAALYAGHMLDIPTTSSRYDMFDKSVPFYQMVFHGSKYFASEAINLAPDPHRALLQAVQTGSLLHYSFIDFENQHNLADTVFEGLFSTDPDFWREKAAEQYGALLEFYQRTLPLRITDFAYLTKDVTQTVYEDGSRAIVNFSKEFFVLDTLTVQPESYALLAGREGQSS